MTAQHHLEHEVEFVTIHGHRRAYVKVGSGPVLLLLHGLGCDHTSWEPVLDRLAEHHTVIAPDLLGHGLSDKPRADYSVGGYANGMRDLLTVLGIEKATVVGHSFGGGVAMQFAYQFPERTERLMLVDPGGLGREVTAVIRAISLPAWGPASAVATLPGLRHTAVRTLRTLSRLPIRHTHDLGEVAQILDSLKDPQGRRAMRHLVRAVIDWQGQVISMRDRAYLTEHMPLHVVWGRDDMVIPVAHADVVTELAPGAAVTVLDDAGHFPHKDHPDHFADLVTAWLASTEPARHNRGTWRRLLRTGGRRPPLRAVASA